MDALKEVACDTGKPFPEVERVFRILLEAAECGVTFVVEGGELKAVSDSDNLPQHLLKDVNATYDDIAELYDHITRACLKVVGGSIQ